MRHLHIKLFHVLALNFAGISTAMRIIALPQGRICAPTHLRRSGPICFLKIATSAKWAFENILVGWWQLGFQRRVFCFKLRNPLMQSVNIFHQFFPLVNGCSKFSLYQWGFDCQGS